MKLEHMIEIGKQENQMNCHFLPYNKQRGYIKALSKCGISLITTVKPLSPTRRSHACRAPAS